MVLNSSPLCTCWQVKQNTPPITFSAECSKHDLIPPEWSTRSCCHLSIKTDLKCRCRLHEKKKPGAERWHRLQAKSMNPNQKVRSSARAGAPGGSTTVPLPAPCTAQSLGPPYQTLRQGDRAGGGGRLGRDSAPRGFSPTPGTAERPAPLASANNRDTQSKRTSRWS